MSSKLVWLLGGILLTFATVVLLVDHALYPGIPGTDAGATPPEFLVTLRDVAFFILTISCILFVIFWLYTLRFEWHTKSVGNRAGSAFLALNAAFFVASLVYVFVYRYELSASAQAGSTASNFYYAAIVELGLGMVLFSGASCRSDPWTCTNVLRIIFDVIQIIFQILFMVG